MKFPLEEQSNPHSEENKDDPETLPSSVDGQNNGHSPGKMQHNSNQMNLFVINN